MHNYKIDKSLDFLQKAVSNNSPLFKDIAFTFEGKKPKFQSQKLSELLNTNLSNLCKALQETRLYRYFVI